MKIYNTLTKEKEEFIPQKKGEVGIYACGVTVYMPLHLGHIRTYIAYDVMVEYLRNFSKLKVFYVRNITDVGSIVGDADEGEDKIELKAAEKKMHPLELVDINIRGMWEELDAVRCSRPNITPRATGHILDIIQAVEQMIDDGFAYELDGNVYCDVSKIPNYGILSGNTLDALNAGARIAVNSKKHTPHDFAIWKKAGPRSVLKWRSPWGMGYPGWHIECTVMSQKYLGNTFDIHGGGRELAFPHHENEIAQSFALCGCAPAKYWMHTGMLNAADGTKMSKSKGNYITVEEALAKWGARALRWFVINAHYRSPLNYSDDAVKATNAGLERIENFFFGLNNNVGEGYNRALNDSLIKFGKVFEQHMEDDLNTANAIAAIFDFIKEANQTVMTRCYNVDNIKEIKAFFTSIDTVFKCFDFLYDTNSEFDSRRNKIEELMTKRNEFRKEKNFIKADELKAKIIELGAEVLDNKDGTSSVKIKD